MTGSDIRTPAAHSLRFLRLAAFIYMFFVSISLLGAAFEQLGEGMAQELLASTSNPFVGLFVGILATSIVQSSSTVTSITVALVATGGLDLSRAIPIIMGANMGTSVTNAIVAAGHIGKPDEFKRAFAAAVVDDFFEICCMVILFPLQLNFDVLGKSAAFLSMGFTELGGLEVADPLGAVLGPTVATISAICKHSGPVMMVVALGLLFTALHLMVKELGRLFMGRLGNFLDSTLFRSPGRAMLIGFGATALIQSSSLTTSLAVPLAGAGYITLRQVFPYALGANVGTTLTAILAALATGQQVALTAAFAHLLYNLFGTALIWPVRRLPLSLARRLAEYSESSRAVPFAYVLFVFFVLPMLLIALLR